MSVFNRLGLNFPTQRFGDAAKLSDGAKNTLNLISDNTPKLDTWQKTDLAAGPVNRTTYFQNRAAGYCTTITVSAQSIYASANLVKNYSLMSAATGLITASSAFKSHTDNLSGVVVVTNANVPSYDTASSIGQQSMMTLTRTDGEQSDTTPILGAFTSLFIQDILAANATVLSGQGTGYAASIVTTENTDSNGNVTIEYSTTYTPTQTTDIESYVISTTSVLDTRRTHDWTFWQNSIQVAKDLGFLSQFNNMGGTNTYLVNNVCGTDSLKAKLASANTA